MRRYTIYDDLLTIAPGGWQGGFVPAEDECYEPNLKDFTQRVPIAVYRRGDSPTSPPCSAKVLKCPELALVGVVPCMSCVVSYTRVWMGS